MYVIAVANQKGGVAKTTTTVSLGAALAETGRRVLLMDLDPSANLSMALNIKPNSIQYSICDVLLGTVPLTKVIKSTEMPGLDIAPGKTDLTTAEQTLPIRHHYDMTLRLALAVSPSDYDYILLDCGPFAGVVMLNALTAADLLLLPTQAELFSFYALRGIMKMVNKVRTQNNPALAYRILLTMYEAQNKVHRTLKDQLHLTFHEGVMRTVIARDTKLRESQIVCEPIVAYAPRSRAARQYRELATEVLEVAMQKLTNESGFDHHA